MLCLAVRNVLLSKTALLLLLWRLHRCIFADIALRLVWQLIALQRFVVPGESSRSSSMRCRKPLILLSQSISNRKWLCCVLSKEDVAESGESAPLQAQGDRSSQESPSEVSTILLGCIKICNSNAVPQLGCYHSSLCEDHILQSRSWHLAE